MKLKKVQRTLIALTLTCAIAVTPVFAAPEDEQEKLEAQKATAQNEANALQSQLNSLIEKMNDLELQLISKGEEIIQAEEDLKVAEEKEKKQYEDLKKRIKYMYESGEGSALERVLTSGSIAEILTQAEYVEKVHTYDRKQLDVYQETVQEVKDLKKTLEEDQAKLQKMEGEYKTQKEELSTTLESKTAEVENLDAMIQEAARKAAEKAEEERRKAEEAAQQQQQDNNIGGGTTDQGSGGTGDNGNTGGGSQEPTYNPITGNTVVDRAYGCLGLPYVWGATGPSSFDCSGLVGYCITGGYGRLGTTWTFLTYPQVYDPQPGDICVNAQHCGIYIGGGQMIHAPEEGDVVKVGPVQGGMIYVRSPY